MANICSFLFVQLRVAVLIKGRFYSDCSTVVFLCYYRRVIRDLYLA